MLNIIKGDLCSLGGVILILVLLGRIYADARQKFWGSIVAIIGFLAYGAYSFHLTPPKSAQDLFHITLCALVVFGLLLGLSWIVLPLIVGLLRPVAKAIRDSAQASRRAWEEWERQRQEREQLWREEDEWRLSAPEREQAQKEAEKVERKKLAERKRRTDALAACELLYQLHGAKIQAQFPRASFDEFVKNFMGPDKTVEEMEQRAIQLQNLIHGHVIKIDPPEKKLPAKERGEARGEASKYYQAHAELLKEVYPPELFASYLRLAMGDNLEPEQCWAAGHKLIEQLRELVAMENKKRGKDGDRKKEVEKEERLIRQKIEGCQQDIEDLRSQQQKSPRPEILEEEIQKISAEIRNLQRQLKTLDQGANDA